MGDCDISQDVGVLAEKLYGSDSDLDFVTRLIGVEGDIAAVRKALRNECGLVQDPISGMWMQLLSDRLTTKDL